MIAAIPTILTQYDFTQIDPLALLCFAVAGYYVMVNDIPSAAGAQFKDLMWSPHAPLGS